MGKLSQTAAMMGTMTDTRPASVGGVLRNLELQYAVGWDLVPALGAAGGSAWLELNHPEALSTAIGPASTVIAIVVGFGIAGIGVQAAFMDEEFLRKVKLIGADPARYLRNLLLTIVIGIGAALMILLLAALPLSAPDWLRATSASLAGLLTVWTLASVPSNLSTLIAFIRVREDAAEIDAATVHRFSGEQGERETR